ncbi:MULTISPECIES: plasmid partitioning protein RepB [unclassified Rhizobium]|uniref:plasmid partitioning protein RepB n=1 Tax=unclassified Rhizobium TaxID=2613769 RepID=UPI001620B603|nr:MULTISPECIES: plasmid partitioning protein RepB [unclassified Rhizobium]MBB3319686.1 ParB family chromosome partitioning protein [Rhizobium sp. BK181]MCS4095491.1 ParB family chromosome partitioning protein [Rhizobium sp. BK176]
MSRKDSRGMFANVLGQLEQPSAAPSVKPTSSPHLLKVAAGVRQIQEKGEALDRLLKDADHVVDVDPIDVAPSSIPDRFDGAYDEAAIEEIAASIRERGQIVPGLIRPFKGDGAPYQIVFGRRRLAAVKMLGLKFRAIVRDLSDEEAIIFQGEENASRNDLSFIEKCAFALSQEQAGYRRDVICASLATGKSHLSEMLRIATAIPRDVLVQIGPSPEIGRRRWIDFADAFAASPGGADRIRQALGQDRHGGPKDRFAVALAALKSEAGPASSLKAATEIRANGFLIATVSHAKSGSKISFNKAVAPSFIDFLNDRMESLHSEFVQSTQRNSKG